MDEIDFVKTRIREKLNQIADHMANGGCADYEQYQNLVGGIKGLGFVEEIIEDIDAKRNTD